MAEVTVSPWHWLLLAALFAGLLIWGLRTGSMPAKGFAINRAEYPKLFWCNAILLGLFAIGSLAAAIDTGL